MLINKTLDTSTILGSSKPLPDGLNYFLLFLMFAIIIIGVVVVIYFAKWLTMGPKLKKRWKKITGKDKGPSKINGVTVTKGQVVVEAGYEASLRRKIETATSPQEKLDYQVKLEEHIKQKEKAAAEIKKEEQDKLAKIEAKTNASRLKNEAKAEAKRIKEANKRK